MTMKTSTRQSLENRFQGESADDDAEAGTAAKAAMTVALSLSHPLLL
jgi:hypothetical protein